MTWNYRLVEIPNKLDEPLIGIVEAYYDEAGQVRAVTEEALLIGMNADDLRITLTNMLDALDKPLLSPPWPLSEE